jgi:hypothetical protein
MQQKASQLCYIQGSLIKKITYAEGPGFNQRIKIAATVSLNEPKYKKKYSFINQP